MKLKTEFEPLNYFLPTSRCGAVMALLLWLVFLLPVQTASAQSDELIVITHPLAGAVIEAGSTIYFSPSSQPVYQWRITIGASPSISGLYDSGIRFFDDEPWEHIIDGLLNDGKPVTVRFWQRESDGAAWVFTDTVFNTRVEGQFTPLNAAPIVTPAPIPEVSVVPVPVTATIPDTSAADILSTVPTTSLNNGSEFVIQEVPAVTGAKNVVLKEVSDKELLPQIPRLQEQAKPVQNSLVGVVENKGSTVKALQAEYRNGQTFLVWSEVQGDVGYHVYRHTTPISSENIGSAEKLTAKWGPLDNDTSINKHAHGAVPATYVISDLGQPLAEANGLFVNTVSATGDFYYAVTTVAGGKENIAIVTGDNSLSGAISEAVADTKPVLTLSQNKGKGRLYTQYMDYARWNPTFNGYAYNYSVTLPAGYRKRSAYPLLLRPHAYGEELAYKKESEYGWQVIQIFPQDPGYRRGSKTHSWWFGYSADHNYAVDGAIPASGSIANFTEERVMKAIKDTIDDPEINVDTQLIAAFGHSMGASGSLALGTRYGNVFAGIFGNEAMTNYSTSPKFQENLELLWGSQSDNLPVTIRGPYTDPISGYSGTGVWDWMNHQKQLIERRGDRMAYLMLSHGKADTVVDWETQGAPMARIFNAASVGYSSRFVQDAAHAWLGFSAIVKPLFGFGADVNFPWRYPRSLSFPAIANASGSGPLVPGLTQTDTYNMDIEWATPHTNFAKSIVDKPGRYEISIRSKSDPQTADITPRNSQQFVVNPGDQCGWVAVDSNKNKTVGSGNVIVDEDGLVTIPGVLITPYQGTRLAIECS